MPSHAAHAKTTANSIGTVADHHVGPITHSPSPRLPAGAVSRSATSPTTATTTTTATPSRCGSCCCFTTLHGLTAQTNASYSPGNLSSSAYLRLLVEFLGSIISIIYNTI